MADQFRILVKNRSGASQRFFLFYESPSVSEGVKVFQNVHASTAPVPDKTGSAMFSVFKEHYAVTGTSPKTIGAGASAVTCDYQIVKVNQGGKLGTAAAMTAGPGGDGAQFVGELLKQDCQVNGSFSIRTDGSFEVPNEAHQFVGVGAADPNDPSNIVPVATFQAEPNLLYYIIPQSVYYITYGSFKKGDLVDTTTIGNPVKIDFGGKGAQVAQVVMTSDGKWSDVTFS